MEFTFSVHFPWCRGTDAPSQRRRVIAGHPGNGFVVALVGCPHHIGDNVFVSSTISKVAAGGS